MEGPKGNSDPFTGKLADANVPGSDVLLSSAGVVERSAKGTVSFTPPDSRAKDTWKWIPGRIEGRCSLGRDDCVKGNRRLTRAEKPISLSP